MTETQRAALMAAEGAFRRYTHHHITKNDGEKAKENYALADMMAAALAEHGPADAPAGYTTSPITWKSPRHHSEQIVKITQRQQPEYGFTHAVFNAPQRREPLTDEQNRAAFADFVKKEMGDIAVMDAGRYISPKIQNYWSVWQFAHGIGDKP